MPGASPPLVKTPILLGLTILLARLPVAAIQNRALDFHEDVGSRGLATMIPMVASTPCT